MIEIKGIYNGENLYVQNPLNKSGTSFCVTEVLVNDKPTFGQTEAAAFEIDLQVAALRPGDAVTVQIHHQDGCSPNVLNPDALKVRSTFDLISINVVQQGADCFLKWETRNEHGKLNFVIEQYRWNKWVAIAETKGGGDPRQNSYEVKVIPHSGNNVFRVQQTDYTRQPRPSKSVEWASDKPVVTFAYQKASATVTFSAETLYEVVDRYGNIVRKGFGRSFNIANLAIGPYNLNYDNTSGGMIRKV